MRLSITEAKNILYSHSKKLHIKRKDTLFLLTSRELTESNEIIVVSYHKETRSEISRIAVEKFNHSKKSIKWYQEDIKKYSKVLPYREYRYLFCPENESDTTYLFRS